MCTILSLKEKTLLCLQPGEEQELGVGRRRQEASESKGKKVATQTCHVTEKGGVRPQDEAVKSSVALLRADSIEYHPSVVFHPDSFLLKKFVCNPRYINI